MTLRKKLAVSTIAASVAMSALAGIPLSNKGLAEKLGVSEVAYATSTSTGSYTTFLEEAREYYAALATVEDGVESVNAFRAELAAAIAADSTILDSFVNKLPSGDQAKFRTMIVDLLSITVGSNWETQLETKRTQYASFLQGLSPNGVTLTVDNVAQFLLALETNVIELMLDSTELVEDEALLADAIKEAIRSAVETNANVDAVITFYNITTADFVPVVEKLQNGNFVNIMTGINALLALAEAYDIVNAPEPAPGPGPAPGPAPAPVEIELPKAVNDYVGKLGDLKDSIAKATGEEKTKLIEAAVKEAQTLVNTLTTISNTVTTVNGKAVLQLDESNTISAIAGIAAIVEGLKSASGETLPEVKLTINLGNVTQNDTVIDLSNAIIQQAVKANISAVTLIVGDLMVELPVGGQFSSAINFTISKSDAKAEVIGNSLKAASKVYDFNLSIGGVAITKFDQPILISIPLGDTTSLDTELLSVAKIVNGKLIFQGGRIKNGHIVEPRDTFSSYVVVENKVSFSDIVSVEAWAGREIQVIAAKGAIEGKAAGKFAPQDKVTRAEFAKMLIRALDLDNGSATESFDDVKASDWHAPYVAAAANLKIINGRSASKFDPNAKITRAEMATMIARALKVSQGAADVADADAALKGFADAGKISASLKSGVAFAASNGIVKGNAGKFLPNNNATRAEAAVIIYRAINFGE
ncbi:MAG: S-layer homology domain-containing protein [Bacillota bacterium]